MNAKSLVLLAVAAACGLIAMVLFEKMSNQTVSAEEQKIKVLVATVEISPGTQLDESNVEFREYPINVVPTNAVTTPEEYEERAVKVRTFPGDIIILDKLSNKGEVGVSNNIPSGMMAIAIGVDRTMTSSGLLMPGNRVDVLVTLQTPGRIGLGKQIKTVLEWVEVLATDDKSEIESSKSDQNTSTVTLLLDMDEARLVKLAEDVGKLHLGMRSKKEDQPKRAAESVLFKPAELLDFFNQDEEKGNEEVEGREKDITTDDDKPSPKTEDLTSFLDGNLSEPDPEPAQSTFTITSPQVFAAEPRMWQVEIFSGDVLRVEEVPLPPTLEAQTSGNPVIDSLRRMFGVKVHETPKTDPENSKNDSQAKDLKGSRPAQKPSDSPLFPSARASSLSEIRQR
ncbi:MAG: Flp pilus assembly protein CpaB [Planctomycetota bacterium]|nr:Flp pilus assembly protein CpaB [Planctomycetota bacterium]MDA1250785.1 Flp pilus assembly protein CpaB [Planctomycetota bacterium]